ncbi:MAG TPA: carboxypeptidase regulatory-like domain-containing protein [Longimicrobiales bacterium]|nr:carboxypeptidase regulatory-like domain-containing protein [Longimicrobiales bacterium]
MPRHTLSAPFAFALALALLAAPAAAQTIAGVVLEDGTERPLPGVLLLLVDERGRTGAEVVADDSGAFRIELPEPGVYTIRGSLIGYAPIASEPLTVRPGESIIVEVRLAIEAVPLAPLIVRSRVGTLDSQLAGFYSRMARGRRSGQGHFISRSEVDRMAPIQSTDLLRTTPGIRVVRGRTGYGAGLRMTSGCVPAIFVDGTQVNRYPLNNASLDDIVSAFSIEGIEVYRGASAAVGRFHDPGGCGLVLVWTRRGTTSDEPWSWKKFLAGLALVAGLLLLMR